MTNHKRTVILMRGISGAGKTTRAKLIVSKAHANFYVAKSVSADDYFTDSNGKYHFDPSKLSLAHDTCFENYVRLLLEYRRVNKAIIVVDNTNLEFRYVERYIEAAKAIGYRIRVVQITATTEVGYQRNVHNVPLDTLIRQQKQYNKEYDLFWSYNFSCIC